MGGSGVMLSVILTDSMDEEGSISWFFDIGAPFFSALPSFTEVYREAIGTVGMAGLSDGVGQASTAARDRMATAAGKRAAADGL